jgi:PAS domain S-box-containing protein
MSNAEPTILVPSQPDASLLKQVREGSDFVGMVPRSEDAQLEVRVLVSDRDRGYFLQAIYPTSSAITSLTETVQDAYNHYKELAFLRTSLKSTFTLALALVLLFSLLSAIWAAFFSARHLVAPIIDIAEGTRAVAKGDYDMQLPLPRVRDELGFLVSSFNTMTRRIAQSRDAATGSQRLVEAQRAYLETVLGRLSSGVMALDAHGRIQTANHAAHDILKLDLDHFLGKPVQAMAQVSPQLRQFVEAIQEPISREMREWREEVKLFGGSGRQVLLCRGTPLAQPDDESVGYALVFDDITMLIKAQRDAAWGEVARRLAHEIKNPLTPIQLSAERLRHKYLGQMSEKDARVLDRATHTIVQQVEAMKEMVNAFSDYARPPKMNAQPMVLDSVVSEVLDLYRSAGLQLRIEVDLGAPDASVEADPVRLRQVIHNLVKNATEAAVEITDPPVAPAIEVATRVVTESESQLVELRVSDNGPGFDNDTLGHLFEPYVTTKAKGTGLGLAIVKKITEEHSGEVWAQNRDGRGASLFLRLPVVSVADEPAAAGEAEGEQA